MFRSRLSGEDYIELLPADWRAITDTGVQIDYRTYNSPELRFWAGHSSGVASKAGRWEVHYDPYDVSRVWVRNHHGQGGSPRGGPIRVWWASRSRISPGGSPAGSPPAVVLTTPTRWPSR